MARISRRAWLLGCLAAGCGEARPTESVAASAMSAGAPANPSPSPPPRSSASAFASASASDAGAISAIAAAFPELARRLPRVHLGRYPSALAEVAGLAAATGARRLLVKRDDLASDVFGGGKARKLELLLGEAIAARHETIVTFGGAGSNQAVATARFGKQLGLHVVLYLAPQVRGPHVSRALFAMQRAGAELRFTPSVSEAEAEVAAATKRGMRAYVIPPGASSPLGDLAFVEAGIELAVDLREARLDAAAVFIACGTGGSAAGLAVGLRAAGSKAKIVAVRASSPGTSSRSRLDALAIAAVSAARALDGTFPTIAAKDLALTIDGGELGGGYGQPTADGAAMIARAGAIGFRLEPVYTAKAMAALARHAASRPDDALVFWATQHGGDLGEAGDVADLPAAFRALARP